MNKNFGSGFADRRDRAAEAKKALLERFSTRADPNDPAIQARAAQRQAAQEARDKRAAERQVARAAAEQAAAEQAIIDAAAREAEAAAQVERDAAKLIEQKAQRDARYAARKAKQ